MTKAFSRTANIDIRDSTPDWGPYEQPKPPDGAPNVVYLVVDDVGFGAMSVFGGLKETPNLERLAEATTGFPGGSGHIPFETATIAEELADAGYNTYMTGKWHCCPEDEMNMASSKRNWPTAAVSSATTDSSPGNEPVVPRSHPGPAVRRAAVRTRKSLPPGQGPRRQGSLHLLPEHARGARSRCSKHPWSLVQPCR
jgi:arylsulfatase A-like enzyme